MTLRFACPEKPIKLVLFGVALFIFLFAIQQVSDAQKNYRIVYNVLEDKQKDNYEIYSMNMDGSDKINITNTPGVEWAYHAYKDKVYYVSDIDTCHRCYFLYEMDAYGKGKRKVSGLQLEDSWMGRYDDASGNYMLVMGRIGKDIRNQLFQVNISDGIFRQLTNDTTSTKRDPLYIPYWKEVVMAYRPDKSLRKTVPDELWKFCFDEKKCGPNPLNTGKIQLTHFPKGDTITQWYEYHAGPPQLNNRKKFISYLSRQQGVNQIHAVSIDGNKNWQITSGSMMSGWHSWSSDGKWLAMDKSTLDEKSYDVYLMNYKTKRTVQLTNDVKYEQAPVIVEVKN